jgi:hypothetical protein
MNQLTNMSCIVHCLWCIWSRRSKGCDGQTVKVLNFRRFVPESLIFFAEIYVKAVDYSHLTGIHFRKSPLPILSRITLILHNCNDTVYFRSNYYYYYYYYYYYCSTALCWALAAFSVSWSYTQSVGLLGHGICPSQGRYLHTEQHKHRINAHNTDIHALSRIRTHDPSVRAKEDS